MSFHTNHFCTVVCEPAGPSEPRTVATAPFATCGDYGEGGIERNFVLSGSDALIAADGAVIVTFKENGDDIAVEYSRMTVHTR